MEDNNKGTAELYPTPSEGWGYYTWGDNCKGWVLMDTDNMSVKRELMPPNTAEQLHYHQFATQFFFILKGTAIFTIDDEVNIVNANQGIEILPGQKHYISNHNKADLEFILYSHPSTKNDRVSLTPEEGIRHKKEDRE